MTFCINVKNRLTTSFFNSDFYPGYLENRYGNQPVVLLQRTFPHMLKHTYTYISKSTKPISKNTTASNSDSFYDRGSRV